jgi:hypothetical protein
MYVTTHYENFQEYEKLARTQGRGADASAVRDEAADYREEMTSESFSYETLKHAGQRLEQHCATPGQGPVHVANRFDDQSAVGPPEGSC